MDRANRPRFWQAIEAGFFGLAMALSPLGGYAQSAGISTVLLVGLLILLGCSVGVWLLTRLVKGARVALIQASLFGAASTVALFVFLAGAPPTSIALLGLAGFILGIAHAITGPPAWLDWLWVVVALAGFWFIRFVPTGLWSGTEASLWAVGLGLAGTLGTSLLANRLRTSQIVRLWAYVLLVSLIWASPILHIFDHPTRAWVVPWTAWLSVVAATLVVGALGYAFEQKWFPVLWAMPSLLELRTQAGDAFLAKRQFQRALSHYEEALWAYPAAPYTQCRKAYALFRLGRTEEAYGVAGSMSRYLMDEFRAGPLEQQKITLTLLQGLGKAGGLLKWEDAGRRILGAIGSGDAEFRSLARQVVIDADAEAVPLLIGGLDHTSRAIRRFGLERLLSLGLIKEVEQQLAERISDVATPVILDAVQAILRPSREAWTRLGEQITRQGGAYGLDVLAEAMGDPELKSQAGRVWNALRVPLSRRLLQEFREGPLERQKITLTLLRELGKAGELFEWAETRRHILNAVGSKDVEFRSLARQVVVEAGDKSVPLLVSGLGHATKAARRFSLERLLSYGLMGEIERRLADRLSSAATPTVLAVVQTILRPSREAWIGLGEQIARQRGTRGLDVLAEAMGDPELESRAGQVWDALRDHLFHRLLKALWEDDVTLALRAAELAIQMGAGFVTPLVEALTTRQPAARRRAANQLARIALLGEHIAGVESYSSVEPPPAQIHVALSAEPGRPYALPIPVVTLVDGRQMLLLVKNEGYTLYVESPTSIGVSGAGTASRIHFEIITDDVPVEPTFHKVLKTRQLDFHLAPDTVGLDRLSIHMVADGREQEPLAYEVFVCDAAVMKGLKPVEKGP
jgi:tetratricopeptide (TPR) repeat protein